MTVSAPHQLVHLSDTHILLPGQRLDGRVDTAAGLVAAVHRIQGLFPQPLGVLITGDLVDAGTPASYAHLRDLLSPLEIPVWLMPGNHDHRQALRDAFADHDWLRGADTSDFIQYTIDLPGLRLVTLDTVVPGHGHGALCAQRLAWLDRTLAQAPATPTLLAMHHPPFSTRIGHMDQMGLLEGTQAFTEVVARHPQVERIVCGHIHRSTQRRLAHTVAITIPSTAHQITLTIGDSPGSYVMEPPCLALHVWDHGTDLVTHLLLTHPFPGPFAFT